MRTIRWRALRFALSFLLLASPVPAQPPSGRALSLDDVIEIALARSPALKSAQHQVEASDSGASAARGEFWGKMNLFAENLYAGFDDVNERGLIPRVQLFPERDNDDIFGRNTVTAGVSYQIPIYTGGRLTAQVELSEFAAQASRDRLQQTADDLILNLASTYYTLLRLAEDIKAAEASVRALEESRRVIARAVEVGRRPRLDLLKVDTRLASVRQLLIRRRNAETVAQGALAALMGLEDVTQRFQLAGPLKHAPRPADLDQSIREALKRRPAYSALEKEASIAQQQVRVAESRRLPEVFLRFVYLGAANNEQSKVQDDFTATLGVRLPIDTGGVLGSRIAEARARLAQAQARLARLRLAVAQEVQGSFFRVKDAEERAAAAKTALETAAEALRIERLKLDVGKGIIEDLLDAQREELGAQANYFAALADANSASMALRKAIGVIRPVRPRK